MFESLNSVHNSTSLRHSSTSTVTKITDVRNIYEITKCYIIKREKERESRKREREEERGAERERKRDKRHGQETRNTLYFIYLEIREGGGRKL